MGTPVRFYLNGELQTLAVEDPTASVLDILRYRLGKTGTKEGCAEGDCGACTVVLGRLEGDRLRYRTVNACILFLPEIDGAELLTVEGLRDGEGGLHPLQQAMVESHASQCGFCTPGFVMALYGHWLEEGSCERASLKDAIAGNLCRCTGYGPILAAGEGMATFDPGLRPDRDEVAARLRALRRDTPLDIAGRCPVTGVTKRYQAPRTVAALEQALDAAPDAILLAGGTDVGLWVTKQHRRLDHVISLGRIEELRAIGESASDIVFGAGVRLADFHARICGLYPDFAEILRRFGAVQVRQSGTIGGNIANGSPIGDTMPPLIALKARLVLRSHQGRRELPLEDFYLGYGKRDLRPGEFVEAVRLPKPHDGLFFRAWKISKRFDQDISALCGAFAIGLKGDRIAEARIAFGGMAATPKRAQHTEAVLSGNGWDEETLARAMAALGEDFSPIDDLRASADYRLHVARNLLRKVWLEHAGETVPRLGTGEAVHA